MSWKNKASFLKFGSVQHRIGGEEFTFYGLTSSTLFRFEGMAKDLTLAFSALFRESDLTFSFEERVFKDGRETIRHPAQENLVRLRAEEQAKALDRLCGAVFAKENQSLLAE